MDQLHRYLQALQVLQALQGRRIQALATNAARCAALRVDWTPRAPGHRPWGCHGNTRNRTRAAGPITTNTSQRDARPKWPSEW